MRITVMGAALAGLLSAAAPGIAADSDRDRSGGAQAAEPGQEVRVFRTTPAGEAATREERQRNYRSCLFTYLPRIGSDAAAEMLREACRDEFLGER